MRYRITCESIYVYDFMFAPASAAESVVIFIHGSVKF